MSHSRFVSFALIVALAACGGSSTAPHRTVPPDPYVAIHLVDALDTTTAWGRATWNVFGLVYGTPDTSPNNLGVFYQGNVGLVDIRLDHTLRCFRFAEDSVGHRQITILAIADTVGTTQDAQAASLAAAWYGGDHSLPSGFAAIILGPLDPIVSAQYDAGHGLTPADPVRWTLHWSGAGSTSFVEAPTDAACLPQ